MMLYKEFKISRNLAQALKDKRFEVRIDHNFAGVMRACASIKRPGQQRSWIEPEMEQEYGILQHQGIAHSIEAYLEGQTGR